MSPNPVQSPPNRSSRFEPCVLALVLLFFGSASADEPLDAGIPVPAQDDELQRPTGPPASPNLARWIARKTRTAERELQRTERHSPGDPALVGQLRGLAFLYDQGGRDDDAESTYRQSLRQSRALAEQPNPEVGYSLNALSGFLWDHGRLEEALAVSEEQLTVATRLFGSESSEVAVSMALVASTAMDLGDPERGRRLLVRAASIIDSLPNPAAEHAADVYLVVGTAHRRAGDNVAALGSYEAWLEVERSRFDNDPRGLTDALLSVASVALTLGNAPHSVKLAEEALELQRVSLGQGHPDLAATLTLLSTLSRRTGRRDRCVPLLQEAFAIRQRVLGASDPETLQTAVHLAMELHAAGEGSKAEAIAAQVVHAAPQGSRVQADALAWRSLALQQSGRNEEAITDLQSEMVIRESLGGYAAIDRGIDLNRLALLNRELGRTDRALAIAQEALKANLDALGTHHTVVAMSLNNLGLCHWDLLENSLARDYFGRAVAVLDAVNGSDHPDLVQPLNNLADALFETGATEEGWAASKRALRIQLREQDPLDPDVLDLRLDHISRALWNGAYKSTVEQGQALVEQLERTSQPSRYLVRALILVASSRSMLGDHDIALVELETALRVGSEVLGTHDPLNGLVWLERGAILERAGRRHVAVDAYQQASRLNRQLIAGSEGEVALFARLLRAGREENHSLVVRILRDLIAIAQAEGDSSLVETRTRDLIDGLYSYGASLVGSDDEAVLAEALRVAAEGRELEATLGSEMFPPRFLDVEAVVYVSLGDGGRAVDAALKQLAIYEARLGEDSPGLLPALTHLMTAYSVADDDHSVVAVEERRLVLQRIESGEESQPVLDTLSSIAVRSSLIGEYRRSAEASMKAVAVQQALDPTDLVRQAELLDFAGAAYCDAGLFREGIRVKEDALARLESGKKVASSKTMMEVLGNLAFCRSLAGDDVGSIRDATRLLDLTETEFGLAAPETVSCLLKLLMEVSEMANQPRKAAVLLDDYRRRLETVGRPSSLRATVEILLLRSSILRRLGEPHEALISLDDAWEAASIARAPDAAGLSAAVLEGYAQHYLAVDDGAAALQFLEDARALDESTGQSTSEGRPMDPGLVDLLIDAGLHDAAREAIEDIARSASDDVDRLTPGFARYLTLEAFIIGRLRGRLSAAEGRPDQAALKLAAAAAACRNAYQGTHPACLNTRQFLARALQDTGDVRGALQTAEESAAMAGDDLPADHPFHGGLLVDLAHYRWAVGDIEGARTAMGEAAGVYATMLQGFMAEGSERDRRTLASQVRPAVNMYLSIFSQGRDSLSAYNVALLWKGAVARSSIGAPSTWSTSENLRLKQTLQQFRSQSGELARLTVKPPLDMEPVDVVERLSAVERQRDRLERRLARLTLGSSVQAGPPTSAQVCAGLRDGEVLVDIVEYERVEPGDHTGRRRAYVSFVLRSGSCQDIARVELGDAEPIDAAVEQFRAALSAGRAAASAVNPAGQRLRELVWDRIEVHVDAAQVVVIAPDAALSLVPFGAMVSKGGETLLEKYVFNYAVSGADVTNRSHTSRSSQPVALVVGGIDYGSEPGATATIASRSGPEPCLSSFSPLPATDSEALEVAAILASRLDRTRIELLRGQAADESSVRTAMEQATYIHLATHGFVARACRPTSVARSFRGLPRLQTDESVALAGLALAQVNSVASGQTGASDGVLSAGEIAHLDLSDVEVAVLSACSTGLGEITSGQGVIGLRTAFAIAGADALVVSLWDVEDEPTKQLMSYFYRELADRRNVAEALREAQLALLAANMEQFGQPRVHTWAAFIAAGM